MSAYNNTMQAIRNLHVPCQFMPGQFVMLDNIELQILSVGFNDMGKLEAECVCTDWPTNTPYSIPCSSLKPVRLQPKELKASLRVYQGGRS